MCDSFVRFIILFIFFLNYYFLTPEEVANKKLMRYFTISVKIKVEINYTPVK